MIRLSDQSANSGSNGSSRPSPRLAPIKVAASEANHIVASYRRHRANHGRATCDVRMIGEFIERLARLRAFLLHVPLTTHGLGSIKQCELIENRILMLEDEQYQILSVRRVGGPVQRASCLFQRMDNQLSLYQDHLADQPRLSRRPRLLHRIILNLEDIESELRHPIFALAETRDEVQLNRTFIDRALKQLKRELGVVEGIHQGATLEERIASLGAAVHAILDEDVLYSIESPGSPALPPGDDIDLVELGLRCDRMAELEQQLIEISHDYLNEDLVTSLEAVQRGLDRGERTYALLGPALPDPM